jgi:hypothetical protein
MVEFLSLGKVISGINAGACRRDLVISFGLLNSARHGGSGWTGRTRFIPAELEYCSLKVRLRRLE